MVHPDVMSALSDEARSAREHRHHKYSGTLAPTPLTFRVTDATHVPYWNSTGSWFPLFASSNSKVGGGKLNVPFRDTNLPVVCKCAAIKNTTNAAVRPIPNDVGAGAQLRYFRELKWW